MKRWLICLLTVLIIVMNIVPVSAADSTINKMDVVCNVNRYGDCDLTITAEVYFATPSGEIWLPVGTEARSIDASGYRVSKKVVDGNTWLVLRNSTGTTGTRTFVISMKKIRNVTLNDDKTQTLDAELVNALWTWPFAEMSFLVTMPKEFEARPTFLSGYYADGIHVEYEVEGQTIRGTVPGGLLDQESVTMQMNLPKGYFRLRNRQGGTATVDLVLMAVVAVLCVGYWFQTMRNPFPRQQNRKVSPDGIYAWEFPYVANCGSPDPALLMTEWATLGYLTISVGAGGRITLRARIPMSNERKPHEIRAFAALFRKGRICAADTPRFRKIGRKAARSCRSYWNRRLFDKASGNTKLLELGAAVIFGLSWFRAVDLMLPVWTLRVLLLIPVLPLGIGAGHILQKSLQDLARKKPGSHLLPAVLILVTSLVLSAFGGILITLAALFFEILVVAGTYYGGKRTADGMERIAQIRAFRQYLRSANIHHLQLMLNQDNQYFYDVLPYAEALGMGKRFAKRFANIPLEPCAWLDDPRHQGTTALDFYRRYRKILNRMRGIR